MFPWRWRWLIKKSFKKEFEESILLILVSSIFQINNNNGIYLSNVMQFYVFYKLNEKKNVSFFIIKKEEGEEEEKRAIHYSRFAFLCKIKFQVYQVNCIEMLGHLQSISFLFFSFRIVCCFNCVSFFLLTLLCYCFFSIFHWCGDRNQVQFYETNFIKIN